MIKRLKLSDLIIDAGTQMRCKLEQDVIDGYSVDIKAGKKFPPLVAFYDDKEDEFYLVDGFHRSRAYIANRIKEVLVDVQYGDLKDAIKWACGSNDKHGLQRTPDDKRKAVKTAFETFPELSDNKIADICRVSQPFVSSLSKSERLPVSNQSVNNVINSNSEKPNKTTKSTCPPRRTGKDGKSYPATKTPDKSKSGPPPRKVTQKDETKTPIPPEILDNWNKSVEESGELLAHISKVRTTLRKAQDEKNPTFHEIDYTDDLAKLDMIYEDLKRGQPYAVCFSCNGVMFKNCPDCHKRGWISEHFYKTCVDEETKKVTKR